MGSELEEFRTTHSQSSLRVCLFESNWQRRERNEGNAGDKTAVSDPQLGDTTHRDPPMHAHPRKHISLKTAHTQLKDTQDMHIIHNVYMHSQADILKRCGNEASAAVCLYVQVWVGTVVQKTSNDEHP